MVRTVHNLVRTAARVLVLLLSGLALVVALILAATQVGWVRSWGLEKGLAALNNALQGEVNVGAVGGNILNGLVLHDVTVTADSTRLLDAQVVRLQYQLSPFFRDQIIAVAVEIDHPVIRLIRNEQDSVWNIARVTKPTPVSDTTTTPFPYSIELESLEIIDAHVVVEDRTQKDLFDSTTRIVDFAHLNLERFNLSARADIEPTHQRLLLQNLYFEMPRHEFTLVELSGSFDVDTTGVAIEGMRLETTRSLLDLTARLDSVNIFSDSLDVARWDESPVRLALDAPRVSTLELERFLPSLDFLAGTPSLELVAEGTYGDLNVEQLDLGLTTSSIHLAGRIRNLDDPDSLWFDTRMTDSRLAYSDVPRFVPGLGIPDLSYLGTVAVRNAGYRGTPRDFKGAIDATTAIGTVRGAASLDLREPVMQYRVDAALADANLEPFLGAGYASDFTGRIVAVGSGTTLESINARFALYSEDSRVMGRSYRAVVARGGFNDGGFINLDTARVAFGRQGEPNRQAILSGAPGTIDQFRPAEVERLVRGTASLPWIGAAAFGAPPSLSAGGWLDLRKPNDPRYLLHLRGDRVSPSDLVPGTSEASLTFSGDISGRGFDPDEIEGRADLDITRAVMEDGRTLENVTATLLLENRPGGGRHLELQSSLADLTLDGVWSFESLVNGVGAGMSNLVDYIGRKAQYRGDEISLGGGGVGRPFSATYDLDIRDLAPLQMFIDAGTLDAKGHLSGELSGTSQLFSLTAHGRLDTFAYSADGTNVSLDDARFDLRMRNITPASIGDITEIDLELDTARRVTFNGTTLHSPSLDVQLRDGEFLVSGETVINDNMAVSLTGSVSTRDADAYRLRIDTLDLLLPNSIRLKNEGPILARFGDDGISIDSLALRREGAERIVVSGSLNGNRLEDVQISIEEGRVRYLSNLLEGTEGLDFINGMRGKITAARVTANGTLENPSIEARLVVDSLSYNGTMLGSARLDADYADRNLEALLLLTDLTRGGDTLAPAARLEINRLPIDLSLSAEERLLSGPVDARLQADSLPLAFIGPFIPGMRVLGGRARLTAEVGGSLPDNVTYSGSGRLRDGYILVEGNNIPYFLTGDLRFDPQSLVVSNMVIRNHPRDLLNSRAMVDGVVYFDGLTPTNFNFNIRADRLLVLSEATQAVNETIYGDLVIGAPGGGLRLSGTSFDQPVLTGQVQILTADLTIEEQDAGIDQLQRVNYVDYGDWLAMSSDTAQMGPPAPDFAPADTTRRAELDPLERRLADRIGRTPRLETGGETTFFDALAIDELSLSIAGRSYLTIDLSAFQRLRAELETLEGPLRVNKASGGDMVVVGRVNVEQGSKFTFFKTFDASGYLEFSNARDVTNPLLSITAEHTGRRLVGAEVLQEYTVTARLTGTVEQPELELSYSIEGLPAAPDRETRQRNAISLLLFGKLSEELAGTSIGSQVGVFASELGVSSISSVASRLVTDIIAGGSDIIQSVDVDLSGVQQTQSASETRVHVVSQVGKAVIRVGGRVADPTADGTISIELPLDAFADIGFLRSFVLQLQREAETLRGAGVGSSSTEIETYRIRLQYRILF